MRSRNQRIYLFTIISVYSALLLPCSVMANTTEIVEFDPDFLRMSNSAQIDLSRFNNGASVLPGEYEVDIWLNGKFITTNTILFKDRPDGGMFICVPENILLTLPLANGVLQSATETKCQDLQVRIPEVSMDYDSTRQRLNLTLPQIMVRNIPAGTVPSSEWDSGITAAMLGYNLGVWSNKSYGKNYQQVFGSLNSGVNIGAWYFRHNGNYQWKNKGKNSYEAINTYLQRDIPAFNGRLTVGENNTQGNLFDTVSFTGASLTSDERMLPQSLRGYAPEIRGIAQTNALVSVRQNGQVIYETTVTPGEFVIADLYPTGYGGTLDVTVQEADGRVQRFEVPYAAVVQLLRPGNSRYSFTAGNLRGGFYKTKPSFAELTWQQGLTNVLTGYGGSQFAPGYYALLAGVAISTRIGAISADITQSNNHVTKGQNQQGQSYRLSYSKYLPESGSNFSLATYRYSTQGFLSIQDAMYLRDYNVPVGARIRPRNRATLTFNQTLGDWGQFYLSGSVQDYWGRTGNDQQYQAGYSVSTGKVTWGLSLTRTRDYIGRFSSAWMLSLSMPLGNINNRSIPWLQSSISRDSKGTSEQLSLSGNQGYSQQLSYSLDARRDSTGNSAGTISSSYRSPWTSMSAGYSHGRDYQSMSAGLSGTLVGHKNGISLSPYRGETVALVEAQGAEGAKVNGLPGVIIDSRGYALVMNLTPYQINNVNIDPKGAGDGVEFNTTRKKVAPYSGAVVRLDFGTKVGNTLLLEIRRDDGTPVPFGSTVTDSMGIIVGYTGQSGQLYALVNKQEDVLTIKWGMDKEQQCQLTYKGLSKNKKGTIISRASSCLKNRT